MNQYEYNNVLRFATMGQLLSIFLWCSKRRFCLDTHIHRGMSFQSAYDIATKKTKKQLRIFYNQVKSEQEK